MNVSNLAPVILFVYNRPEHTRQTLEALSNNILAKDSTLYIFADGAKAGANADALAKITETRQVIREKQWCGEIVIKESETNKGLAKSIIEGVTDIVNKYGKVIVLEDDVVTSSYFLKYMNDALDLYKNEEKVMHISAFVPLTTGAEKLPETYFLDISDCWGWATWDRAWQHLITDTEYLYHTIKNAEYFKRYNLDGTANPFDQLQRNYDGTLNTWFIKWYSTIFIKNGLSLYPRYSLVRNIGFDGTGENSTALDVNVHDIPLATKIEVRPIPIIESKQAREYFKRYRTYGRDSGFIRRLRYYLKHTYLFAKVLKMYSRFKTKAEQA